MSIHDDPDRQDVPEDETADQGDTGNGLDDERGIPAVGPQGNNNKSMGKKLLIVAGGVLVLILMAAALLPKHKEPKHQTANADQVITDQLPKMPDIPEKPPEPATPATVATPTATPAPVAGQSAGQRHGRHQMTAAEKLQARRQRSPLIAFGGHSTSGGGGSSQGQQAAGSGGSDLTSNYGRLDKYLAQAGSGGSAGALGGSQSGGGNSLGSQLKGTSTPMVSASLLPDRNFLITKGTFIDCALETAIDTTRQGFTSCRVTHNIYSDNGRVLLVERGSRVTGEYQTQSFNDATQRVFVLWDRLETPNGVVVDLASPGIGPLGKSGLKGYVNHHYWRRFGVAMMVSIFDDYMQYQIQKETEGSQINLNNTENTSEAVPKELLASARGIKPTLYKNQGDHIKIYVARDINFQNVYALAGQRPDADVTIRSHGSKPSEVTVHERGGW